MPRLIPQSNKLVGTVSLFVLFMLAFCVGNDASAQRRRRPAQKAPQQQGAANANTTTSTAQTKPQKKNITPLRGGDTADGSRLTITSDVPLNDYSAYRSGDRYYVEIPDANAPRAQSGLRGRGFEDVQVQRRGDNAIISFKLQPGATARVSQKFNRLDVELSAPGRSTTTVSPTPAPTPATVPQATTRSTPQTPATTPTPAVAGTTGQGNQTQAGVTGVDATPNVIPPGSQTMPPIAGVQPPDASASPGVSPEASPLATPPADQIAQAQPQPETQPITQPASTTPNTSLGATLARNWMLLLIIGLVLASLVLIVAARSRARSTTATTAATTPARRVSRKERLAERAKASDKLSAAAKSGDAAAVKSAIVLKPGTLPKAVKVAKDEEQPAVAIAEETKEVEPVKAVDVERIELEVKNLLRGESYDETLIGSGEAETRQLIATELLSALAARNPERRERARTAFVKHDYLDEATRNLRTAEAAAERASAARSLGYVADSSTTPHLIVALEDKAPEVRRAAVEALADMGDPSAVEPLQSLLKRERNKKVPLSLIERAISASTAVAEEEETTTLTSVRPVPEQEEVTLETAPAVIGEADKPPVMETMGLTSEAATAVLEEEEAVTEAPEVEPSISAITVAELAAAEAATLESEKKEEAERLRAEEDERQRLEAEAEARRAAEEEEFRVEAARLEQEERERLAREQAEREEQQRLEAEARQKAEEEARLKAEAEAERKAEEEAARLRAEEERRLEEEKRLAAEAEAQRQAEEEAARQQAAAEAEEARLRAEAEERRRVEEEKRLAAEAAAAEAARLKAEEEERLRVEAEQRRAEEEARLAAEAEAQRKAEAEARLAAEAEARRKAEEEAAAARLRAEEEARLKAEAEAEAQRKADEEAARLRDEENARRLAAEEAAAALQSKAISPVEQDITEPEPVEASSPVLPFEPAIERNDGSAEGWVEVDIAETEAIHTAEPLMASMGEAAEAEVSPEVSILEPPLESSVVVEEPAVATPASKEIEYAVSEKGVDIFDENTTVPRAILRRLSSEEPDERASAVIDLGRVGGDDSFREINAAFDDPAVEVRNAAARSLFNVHTDRAATFTRALREAPPERRRKIGAALASSGLASEAIGQLMGESREKTYDAFSLLFLMSKAGEVQPLMRAIEEHPNNEVRLAVIKLLALSGQQEILPAFRRLAVRGSLPTEVRSAVMEAIYQLSSQSPTAA